jgi:NAD(P)-dependent dehydrogenase (short-subunit alcohol dehydrogenase family)
MGTASARALADDGTDIIVTYRPIPRRANAVTAELSGRGRTAIALPLDVTDHDSFPASATMPRTGPW